MSKELMQKIQYVSENLIWSYYPRK